MVALTPHGIYKPVTIHGFVLTTIVEFGQHCINITVLCQYLASGFYIARQYKISSDNIYLRPVL